MALAQPPAKPDSVWPTVLGSLLYQFVTHKFASASKGALGFFQAGDVEGAAAGGH
jgi:hypothetical protein